MADAALKTAPAEEAELTDGFNLLIDALKLNGLTTIYGVPGIPITDFGRMSNIAKKTRDRLAELFVIERPEIATEQRSVDGTRKWLLNVGTGNAVEAVYIPEETRGTLCVSSQAGCAGSERAIAPGTSQSRACRWSPVRPTG